MHNLPLKVTLIDALAKLHKYTKNPKQTQAVINALKLVHIPNNDYKKVMYFIYLLAQEKPEILTAYPHNQVLRQLSLYCIQHLQQ